jgi:hypothetical protein
MGLLDDAIREHLDLKRARGSDPAEIERLEREALGPVRREPTIGSARFEAADEHAAPAPETGYPDDRDQLLDPAYHDSTAPHLHPHHGHGHDELFVEPEQPKRRFLRRNRQAPLNDSDLPEPDYHDDPMLDPDDPLAHDDLPGHPGPSDHHDPLQPLEHHDPLEPLAHHDPLQPLEHHDPLEPVEHHDPLAHHDLAEHHESLAHHDVHEHDRGTEQAPPSAMPPHLRFDHPPKRPRFSAEPPPLHPEQDEADTRVHEQVEAAQPAAAPAPEPAEHVVQETTEFDVQKHIAETRFQPDPETQVQPAPTAPPAPQAPGPPAEPAQRAQPAQPAPQAPAEDSLEGEDVLEETPEFLQDTPEHDRLWFEQRPPRDFDFDG